MKSISEIRKQLGEMDDESLGILISTVAQASGVDKSRAEAMVSDIPALRRAIGTVSDSRFSQLIGAIGDSGVDIANGKPPKKR